MIQQKQTSFEDELATQKLKSHEYKIAETEKKIDIQDIINRENNL